MSSTVINFEKIVKLKETRERIKKLREQEREYAKPILCDPSKLQQVYDAFVQILNERNCTPDVTSVYQRKKFLFLAMYIFAPSVLVGDDMPKGFRFALSRILGISGTAISNNCEDVVFLFNHYKDFSADVDDLYINISDCLQLTE